MQWVYFGQNKRSVINILAVIISSYHTGNLIPAEGIELYNL